MTDDGADGGLRRRALLGAGAGLAGSATAGCVQRMQDLFGQRRREQLSLTIKCVPADADPVATQIARRLVNGLQAAGVDADLELLTPAELRRDVLVAQSFDLYVGRFPGHRDPDFLHALLHSVYYTDPGWLNPFGFTDLQVDELLEDQRTATGSRRRELIADALSAVARQQPFTTIAIPDDVSAVRTDSYDGFGRHPIDSPLRFLALEAPNGAPAAPELTVAATDGGATRNLNPLSVAEGTRSPILGLLYDPLAREVDGTVRPWLASETSATAADPTTTVLRLREDLEWHDGEPLDAEDVAFTYDFLADTSMGRLDSPAPAPPYQGPVSLVDDVTVLDERRLEFSFGEVSRPVSRRAFGVPILPEHVWRETTGPAEFAGMSLFDGQVEALVRSNTSPVGSGPLRVESVSAGSSLTLRRFEEHFLTDATGPLAGAIGGGPPFEALTWSVVPSDAAAVELAAAGDADVTGSALTPSVVPRIGRSEDLELQVTRSRGFYHVGYNARRASLGNPHFRRILARLLDEGDVVETILKGYGSPARSPLADTSWCPDELAWGSPEDELTFLGEDGTLDATAVRERLRAAGYEYDGEGRLLSR